MEFGKRMRTIGYAKAERKLAALRVGSVPTGELPAAQLREAAPLAFGCRTLVLPKPADRPGSQEAWPERCLIEVKSQLAPDGACRRLFLISRYNRTAYPRDSSPRHPERCITMEGDA
jgi:hypothetical protein